MKKVLQILQWLPARERWVLKSPQHLEQIGPLLDDISRRDVVVTHRDPVAVVQSAITMLDLRRRTCVPASPAGLVSRYWTDRVGRLLRRVRPRPRAPARERTIDVAVPRVHGRRRRHGRAHLRAAGHHLHRPGARRDRRPTWPATRAARQGRSSTTCAGISTSPPTRCGSRFGAYLDAFPTYGSRSNE